MRASDRIQPSPAELHSLQKQYARRRLIAMTAGVVWMVVWLVTVLALIVMSKAPSRVAASVIFGTWLLVAATLAVVWRCPRCHEHLGRRFNVSRCPHCFVALGD